MENTYEQTIKALREELKKSNAVTSKLIEANERLISLTVMLQMKLNNQSASHVKTTSKG